MGVVADSHVGDLLPRLPRAVLDAMEGMDLILHAGDVTVPGVLDQLREVAPVLAVRGNHDRAADMRLPRKVKATLGGVTIGLTHGDRPTAIDGASVAASLVAGRVVTLGLERMMALRFPGADCVVFGHWHMPVHRMVGSTLVFSPGGAYTMEADGRVSRSLRARAYGRLRRSTPPEAAVPRVGVIDIADGTVAARSVPLDGPLRDRD